MSAWLKLVPSWAWWVLALVLVVGVQQYRVMDAKGELAEARGTCQPHLSQLFNN